MKNIFYHTAGSLLYAVLQWLVIVLFSNYYGVEQVGYYSYYLGFITPLSIFFNCGLRIFIARDGNKEFNDSSYICLRYFSLFLYFILLLPFTFFVDNQSVFIFCFLLKGVDSLSELEYGAWNRKRVIKFFMCSQCLRLILSALFFVAFILFNFEFLYLSFILGMLLTFCLFDLRKSALSKSFDGFRLAEVVKLLRQTSPLIFSSLTAALVVLLNRYFVEGFLGIKNLADYVLLLYFYNVASMFVLSISQVSIPVFSCMDSPFSSTYFLKFVVVLVVYSLFYSAFMFLLSNDFMLFFYNVRVGYSSTVIAMVVVGSTINFFSVFVNSILIAKGLLKYIMKVNVAILIVTSLLMPFLLSNFGEFGAYLSFLVISVLSLLLNALPGIYRSANVR